ncbi:MAG: BrnT family toxin [Candidatus Brocadiae bacterium]|nr:BrnT family toxin [Anaerolineales bacterium]NUN48040.1 BrnT family toxin [Candidatus Brocadiia bacterium]
MALTFEWDAEKARENLRKHNVSFEEAKTIFDDPFSITIADPEHSVDEDRYIDIGLSTKGQFLVVVYTERGTNIRIISCRKATNLERRSYEQEKF